MQKVAVTLDGAQVRGSPFAVHVRAGPLHPPACQLLGLDDHRAAAPGELLPRLVQRPCLSCAGRQLFVLETNVQRQAGPPCADQDAGCRLSCTPPCNLLTRPHGLLHAYSKSQLNSCGRSAILFGQQAKTTFAETASNLALQAALRR